MLAKETGVTVLVVNLLLDLYRSWGPLRRALRDVRWNEEAQLFSRRAAKILMSLTVLLVCRLALLQGSLPKFSQQDNPAAFHPCPQVRLLTFCYLAALNCWLLLCPATLSHDWQFGSVPLVTSLGDGRNLATCALFGVGLLVAYRCVIDFEIQRHPPLILGLLLLCIPFLPASNLLVTVGFVIAERVLYIPSLGMVLLVVYGSQLLWNALFVRQRHLILVATMLVLGAFCLRTAVRNRDWTTRESLAVSGVRDMPNNAKLHYNMGNTLRDTGRKPPAISHYKEALRLWPSYASAHNNLGTLAPSADEAERFFLSAIHYQPAHVNAHYNLGHVYKRENRTEDAIRMWERCISLDPAYGSAYLWLAQLEGEERAGRLLRQLNRRTSPNPKHRAALADWLLKKGRTREALSWFRRALRLDARYARAFLGSLRALRALGQRGRLHQVTLRSLTPKSALCRRIAIVFQHHHGAFEIAHRTPKNDQKAGHAARGGREFNAERKVAMIVRWMSLVGSRPARLYPAELPATRHWGIILESVTVSLKPADCGFGAPCALPGLGSGLGAGLGAPLEDRDSNKSRGQTRGPHAHATRRTTAAASPACASRMDGPCSASHGAGHAAGSSAKGKKKTTKKQTQPSVPGPPRAPAPALVVGNILDTWHSACHSIGQACLH
ncbi:Protein O-mannosyl-transferase TMTC1 [Frankliniella fusca]|uniref:dolichyl-phosphate-mannose--protein mannosyltransferase n=1 Tax=Frankliniella fusca TaxID=407009 RepID=A0AAE1HU59_9NEOP|nr:Protein O-mannosyl-transferase TMTC1 [Frankliniella fusca]